MLPTRHRLLIRQLTSRGFRLHRSYEAPCREFSGIYSQRRSFSSILEEMEDPGNYIEGATRERMLNDPIFADYVKANLPEIFDPGYLGEDLDVWRGIDPRILELIKEKKRAKEEERQKRKERRQRDKHHPLNMRPITSYLREEGTEHRRGHWFREHQNMIPGILLGSDPSMGIYSHEPSSKTLLKTPHNIVQRELNRYNHNFQDSRVYNLTIYRDEEDEEGTKHVVVPKSVNWHPVKEEVYCVNFCRYHAGRPLKLPLKHVNEDMSPALKGDCFIIPIQRKIEVIIEEGVSIPDHLELDCSSLKAQEVIRRDRILLPDGVKFSKRVLRRRFIDYVVGKVEGSSRGMKELNADQAEGEEGAAGSK